MKLTDIKKRVIAILLFVGAGVGFHQTVLGFGAGGADGLGINTYASPISVPFAVPITIDLSGIIYSLSPGFSAPDLPPPPAPPSSCQTDKICVYPTSITFPDTQVDGAGGSMALMSVTLSNPASAPTYVVSDSLGGSAAPFFVDPTSYAALTSGTYGYEIRPGQTAQMLVVFDPRSEGSHTGAVQVQAIPVNINPPGLSDFNKDGAKHQGDDGRWYIYTVIFTTTPEWHVVDCCIENGGGGFGATAEYYTPYGALGTPESTSVSLSGRGIVPPPPPPPATPAQFSVNPLVLNFTDTLVDGVGNAVAGPLTVRVKNDGGTDGSIILSTTLSVDYKISGLPGVVVVPANSFVDVPILFDPQTVGSLPGRLNITPNIGDPVEVQLNGAGIAAPAVLQVRDVATGRSATNGTLTLDPINVPLGGTAAVALQAINAGTGVVENLRYRVLTPGSISSACAGQCTMDDLAQLPVLGSMTWNVSGALYSGTPASLSATVEQLAADGSVIKSITVSAPINWLEAACNNGRDDDGDSLIDVNDPGCDGGITDDDESNTTPPPPPGDGNGGNSGNPGCSPTVIDGCSLPAVAVGENTGICSAGYTGACNYTCQSPENWVRNSNSCALIPPAPTLSVSPVQVVPDNKTTLRWDSNNGDESLCTIVGPGITGNPLVPSVGHPEQGTFDVVINGRTKFILTCPYHPPVTVEAFIPDVFLPT